MSWPRYTCSVVLLHPLICWRRFPWNVSFTCMAESSQFHVLLRLVFFQISHHFVTPKGGSRLRGSVIPVPKKAAEGRVVTYVTFSSLELFTVPRT